MKTWEDFLCEIPEGFGSDINRRLADMDRYITGINNRIMLMQQEEIDSWRHKLTELRNLIDEKLG